MRHPPLAIVALAFCMPSLFAQNTPVVLYTLDGSQPGERLGWTVAAPGDLNGDSVPDILAGGPGDFISGGFPGIARAYSGIDGSVLYTVTGQQNADGFGMSLAVLPDLNGDNRPDFAVGAPYDDASGADSGSAYVFSGATGALIRKINGAAAGDAFGWSLSNGRDFNGDAQPDIAVGAPLADGPFIDAGSVTLLDPVQGTQLGIWTGNAPHAEYGYSIASAWDTMAGPLERLLVIGAPGLVSNKVHFVSAPWGSGVIAGTADGVAVVGCSAISAPNFEAYVAVTSQSTGVVIFYKYIQTLHTWAQQSTHTLGSGIQASLGISADAYSVYALIGTNSVGAYSPQLGRTILTFGSFPYDGGTISLSAAGISRVWATAQPHSLNSDGVDDLLVGDPTVSAGGPDAGRVVLAILTSLQLPIGVYCTAKPNSQGCTPAIGFSGAPTLSVADNFHVTATNVLNNKTGLLLWALNSNSIPFGGGTLCIGPLLHRTGVQLSGGNPGPPDCSGSYDFHFSQAYMSAQALTPGVTVYCQYYSRDDGFPAPQNIGLTNAVRFTVLP